MSKRKMETVPARPAIPRMRVGYTIVNPTGKPVAVAKPASQIQLTPIIQPIAMVPYSTQQQPILSDMDDGGNF